MDEERRKLLKYTALLAAGAGCGFPLLRAGALAFGSAGPAPKSKQWGMVIDIEKCLKPGVMDACRKACHERHNVPNIMEGTKPHPRHQVKWIWPEPYEKAFPDRTHAFDSMSDTPVPVLCNHCNEPPCTKVCPTQATWKRKSDGIVMMDMHRCIGCRYCMAACPYGSRSFNWVDPKDHIAKDKNKIPKGHPYPTRSKGVVEKCSFCAELIRETQEGETPVPHCVRAANALEKGALTFGDLSKEDSEIRQILKKKKTICRRVSVGTGPNVYYIV